MQQQDCIVVTGAAGFIASYLVGHLNKLGYENLVLVDDFSIATKEANLDSKKFSRKIDRNEFIGWWQQHPGSIQQVFHLGARTDTTEMDYEVHKKWNLDYTKAIWQQCTLEQVPLVYASSAATYGDGEFGYADDHSKLKNLVPLNPYGLSKHQFDVWALEQDATPPFWAGVKFFNVYGPNEYHKGRMASVIFHSYHQILGKGGVRLFRSHHPDYTDGGQMRDFVYVKDVVSMCQWLMEKQPESGIYNVGSGKARTFLDLVTALFNSMGKPVDVEFIDTPADIRDKYQYFTEADMSKIRAAGYSTPFHTLEEGISEYATAYLAKGSYF